MQLYTNSGIEVVVVQVHMGKHSTTTFLAMNIQYIIKLLVTTCQGAKYIYITLKSVLLASSGTKNRILIIDFAWVDILV